MKAWFGILYLRGALKLDTDINTVFYHQSSNDIFGPTFQFDDHETPNERWMHDKYACFHEYFEEINNRVPELRY